MMKLLLGRDVVSDAQDDEGMTPLYLASYEGELEVVQALLRHGASVGCRSIEGWTPLQIASQTGHLGVVQLLFESGAAVNSRNNERLYPIACSIPKRTFGCRGFPTSEWCCRGLAFQARQNTIVPSIYEWTSGRREFITSE
jgi:ankyrin repeat protein